MRRRVVPALIALLAAALAAWRHRARRDGATEPGLADDAAAELPAPARRLEAEPAAPQTASAPAAPPAASAPAAPPAASAPTAPPAPPAPLATPEAPAADTGTPASPAPAATPATSDDRGPRFVSVPWTLVGGEEAAASDRRELTIRFTLLGGRMALDRVDVRETDSQVFVTVLARCEPADPGRPAPPPYGVAGETTVRLQRPLGDRALVHAPDQLAELIRRDG